MLLSCPPSSPRKRSVSVLSPLLNRERVVLKGRTGCKCSRGLGEPPCPVLGAQAAERVLPLVPAPCALHFPPYLLPAPSPDSPLQPLPAPPPPAPSPGELALQHPFGTMGHARQESGPERPCFLSLPPRLPPGRGQRALGLPPPHPREGPGLQGPETCPYCVSHPWGPGPRAHPGGWGGGSYGPAVPA